MTLGRATCQRRGQPEEQRLLSHGKTRDGRVSPGHPGWEAAGSYTA